MTAQLLLLLSADPATLYVGAWPRDLLVIDEQKVAVIDRIKLQTDVARAIWHTHDKKRLIAVTTKDSGIETIDLATRKVVDSFTLGTANRKVRFGGGALDPTDRYMYLSATVAEKKIDRFEIEKPKFMVVDLVEKKVVRTGEIPEKAASFGGRGQIEISPDGQTLWMFRDNIYILNTSDFKLVETIELSRPQFPGMESIFLSPADDPFDAPGTMTAVFNTTDPIVHKRVWGVAKVNLNTRKIDFTPVGPAVPGMTGMRISPDRKFGYTATISGEHGDRYCELVVLDLTTRKVVKRAQFPGRTRFSMGLTTDGKSIVIYGAGNTIEMFDTTTLQPTKAVDVAADMTTSLVAVLP
ncbi:MAG: hypothetical protein SFV18_10745 [Bryobacteraceae bacterium]|nr:hypothetical protein [Bryobacteraceae bacterium]